MVRQCCIKDCKSEWWPGTEISFHGFPRREESQKRWLDSIPPSKLRNVNLKYASVCSKHFTEHSFADSINCNLRNVLKRDALPSLFGSDTEPEYVDYEILSEFSDEEDEQENICKVVPAVRDVGTLTTLNKYTFDEIDEYRRRERNLRKRLRRAELKIEELNLIIKAQMRETNVDIIAEAIHKYIPENRRDILLNELSHHVSPSLKKNYKYDVKDFAMTIYLSSRQVYDYLRQKMTLPHPATLRKWLHVEKEATTS